MNEYTTEYENENGVTVTRQAHLPCPYSANVEKRAWLEGYLNAKQCDDSGCTEDEVKAHAEEDSEYTSADTMVAFKQGHEDFSYHPVAIDWNTIDLTNPAIEQRIYSPNRDETTWMLVQWNEWRARAEDNSEKPDWADNRWNDRGIKLQDDYLRNAMRFSIYRQKDASVDLPCPPYEFEAEGSNLTIKAGPFFKTGSKQEWESVLESMQAEVDALPDGISVDDVTVNVDVTAPATATYSVSLAATDLLSGHGQYVDDVWAGSMDELHDALTEAVDEADLDPDYYSDISCDVDDYGEKEGYVPDLTYDLNDAVEL